MVGTEGRKGIFLAGILTVVAIQGLVDMVFPMPHGHGHGHGHDHGDDHGHGDEEAAQEPRYEGAFTGAAKA